MASGPITSWQIDGETMETVTNFIVLGSKIIADGDCSHEIKRRLLRELGMDREAWRAAVPICSDFGAQKNKLSHCFHGFPIYLP